MKPRQLATAPSHGRDRCRFWLVQASVGAGSPLVGRTLREAHFRNQYDGVVVAIHRAVSCQGRHQSPSDGRH